MKEVLLGMGNDQHMEEFNNLMTEYENFIWIKARYYSRDISEADELYQRASIILWQNHNRLASMSEPSIKAFLSSAIKNAVIDLRRKEKHLTSYDKLEVQLPSTDNDWENNLVNNILIMSVLYKLSKIDQDIVFKTYFMKMNSTEIGKQLNLSPATVRTKLRRANQKLKALLLKKEEI